MDYAVKNWSAPDGGVKGGEAYKEVLRRVSEGEG